MVVQITTEEEKITIENVVFVNESMQEGYAVTIQTADSSETTMNSMDKMEILIFTNSGVPLREEE